MTSHRVAELLGDGISAELSASVHAVAEAFPFALEFVPVDLSHENRERRGHAVYEDAVGLAKELGTAFKYPTATTRESPNKVLRERLQFAVIHRPVCSIPGIETNFKRSLDIDVVRVATGGTYDDPGRRIGLDTAVSLRVIERGPSRAAARFAFKLAQVRGSHVVSTSKYTIQRATDGLFEEAVQRVAEDYPAIPHRQELFDALLAGIVMKPEKYRVIVCPNEYGDFLSDAACGLIGSVGLGDSANYSFGDDERVVTAMFDPSGGTAPDIAGKNIANPTAALLALANMVRHLGHPRECDALRGALLGAIADGECTADIRGKLSTTEFTRVVTDRLRAKLG